MPIAHRRSTLRCVLAAALILAAFHTCGHESFCAVAALPAPAPAATPPGDRPHPGDVADASACAASEHASTDCAGDDCLCLCRTPGLATDATPVWVPRVPAGEVKEFRREPSRHIPGLIDRPPRLS